ncbi:amino acid adenylation domain-containing protein (plasmid) [Streptomyces sp. AHU1]|uniref:amino acid adenylation domain-containing protein n=1 Tax=Streptomyces sp. AHU1 TaxID=3377215 RepID=UPI003877C6C7
MSDSHGPRARRVTQIPLSVSQEAMWLGWKLEPDQWSHIIPTPFQVTGNLDSNQLRHAVAAVATAYPQLCGRVVETADGPHLSWTDTTPIPVTEHTVTGDRDSEIRRVWQRPFNLRHGPLARVDVLYGPDWTVLILAVHHLVFDGASILVLLDRLRHAYAGLPLENTDQAPVLAAFSARSRTLTDTPAGDTHRVFWREMLNEPLPVLELPASVDTPGYTVLDSAVPPHLAARLRERAIDLGVSYVSTLLGAYFVLLRRHCGHDDLLASVPFHGRTDNSGRRDPALRETVGYFVNALPLRHHVRAEDHLADVVRSVGGELRAAARHGDLPLPAILREANLSGWDSRTRTRGTVFQYWHAGLREDVDVQNLHLRAPGAKRPEEKICSLALLGMESSADYTLAVMVREDSAGTHVLWKDPEGAIGPTLLRVLADDYLTILEAVANAPETRAGAFTDTVATTRGQVVPSRVAALMEALPGVRRALVTPTAGDAELHIRLTTDEETTEAEALAAVRAELGGDTPRLRITLARVVAEGKQQGDPNPSVSAPALAAMTRVWEEVLGIDGIDPDDSFFELGGHSLIAESLVLAVGRELGREVPLRALFEYPRLGDFVDHLGLNGTEPNGTATAPAAWSAEADIPPCTVTSTTVAASTGSTTPSSRADNTSGRPAVTVPAIGSFPASGFQQRIWLAERVDPDAASYNVPLAWRLPGGGVDVDVLAYALELMTARHEILRTRFIEEEGKLRQHVADVWRPRLDHVDLRDATNTATELRTWLSRAANHSFDPAEGRLLVAAVLETGEADEQVLFICLHHLVWDGESAGVFLRELSSCYDEASRTTTGTPEPDDNESSSATHPASAHQERIGFIDQFEKGTVYPTAPVYHNLPLYLRLDGPLDPARLQDAVNQVVAAHEALRTGLEETSGRITQRVHERAHVKPHWFAPRPDADPTTVPETLRTWASEPFSLDGPSLLRVAVQPSRDGRPWLALVGHQAVVDRTAMLVVGEDLLAALNGANTEPSSYCQWMTGQSVEERARDLDVRAEALGGPIDAVRLPERRPRKPIHVYEEHSVPVRVPDSLRVAEFAERHGLTREDVLLAAFAALLGWYSGRQEMMVGVAHPARRDTDRRVVGPLANLLPLRLEPDAGIGFATLATQVAEELAAARRHDRAPFDELVRRLDPAKDMSRTALFDILFTWAQVPASLPTATELGAGHGKYDLHLFLRPEGTSGASGSLIFNGLYFDDAQIQLMAEHYTALLRAVLDAPGQPLGTVEPLTERERHSQLHVWNDTGAGYPHTTLHELLHERAEQQPGATALTDATLAVPTHHTYRDLIDRAELLARGLMAHGVHPGELVALLLPRGAAQVEAILAVLFAGAAYLPLDPALPEDRKEFILGDSETRWVIVPDGCAADVPSAFDGRVLTSADLADSPGTDVALPDTTPDAPAYCIYTSGTTGRPKGVVISHRNAVRLLANDRFPFSFGPADVWTMAHSYAFDFSVWELFCALSSGGRVVLVADADVRDPRRFWRLLRDQRITVLNQTPTAFRELLAAERDEPAPLDHLRYVIFGGEALQPALLRPWMDAHPHVRLVNMYGITETTVHVTIRTLTRTDADTGTSVIGTPIPTTTVHLLDPNSGQRLLPVGSVGEMYVGGAGVADGYLNQPELTTERFVPNPFGLGRLFRSGDLARYRPDGTLEYLGRADSQVQVRGHRVEPAEIEVLLREHSAVADAAVILEDDRLVGYLLPHREPPQAGDIRAYLRASLPEYMVPGPLRTVRTLPVTPNGKLDQEALRATAVALDTDEGRAPDTPTAEIVAGLWSELLDVQRVGADDSFFALGGHSMLAVRMLRRIGARFGVDLALRLLFENPCLQDFADLVDAKASTSAPRTPETDAAPAASSFQERIWLAERFSQDSAYTIVCAWHAPAGLDHALLQRALGLLISRHEILRTGFAEQDGRLRQRVDAPWTPQLDSLDLRRANPDASLRAWSDAQTATPFDPASGRLFRAALADIGEQGHALLFCFHHLVVDGESIPALLADLQLCYRAAKDGIEVGEVPSQYREFTAALKASQDSPRRTADLDHWERRLAGAPVHTALPVPSAPEPHGAIPLDMPADLTERLRPVQREYGVSWFVIAATALAAALHRITGSDDLTIGVPFSIPDRVRFPGLIGPCLNTVVLRSRPSADATLLDLLTAMRTETLDAHEHGGAPFEEVLERLNPAREPGRTPYTDVTLNMNLFDGRTTGLGDGTITPLVIDPIGMRETKFAVTVTLVEEHGQLRGVLAHRGDRAAAADAHRLADALTEIMIEMASALTQPVALPGGSGHPVPTRPDTIQYRDFVAVETQAHDTARRADDLAYWSAHLAGAPQYTDLGAGGPAEPNGTVDIPLPLDLATRLRLVQRTNDCTLYQLAATALATVLHRWTGQDDVVFAAPLAHRDDPRFADLLGPCLNTVVLRSRPSADATLLDLLTAMRAELLDAHQHGDAPFEDVVDRLNPVRRPGRTPYADITLSLETHPAEPALLAGSPLVHLPLALDGAGYLGKLGLSVVLSLTDNALTGSISYQGTRHRRSDVEQLAALFGRVLTALPDALRTRLDKLDLVSGDSGQEMRLRAWEGGGAPAPATTVPALLDQWVRRTPDAPAVETTGGVLTYRVLHERAVYLATLLRPLLPDTDPVVALLLGRGEDLVVSMLAAWYAGAAFCPIDPATPSERVDNLLADLDACAVVTSDAAATARLTRVGTTVLAPLAPASGPRADITPPAIGPTAVAPTDIAYIIHTSGTTGRPKGVMVRHSSLAQLVRWGAESFGLGPDDRTGQLLGAAFDATQWDVWSALASGGCVVPYEGPVAAAGLAQWLDERRVSVVLLATPLAEALWAAEPSMPHLRWMLVGAAPLTRRPPAGTTYRVRNAYGPTESTVIALTHDLHADDQGPLNVPGRPITGTDVLILDPYGQRCPAGVTGEICISGAGVAAGYWRRPDLNAERFRPAAEATVQLGDAPVVYRTGDQGRRLTDGTIQYLGRVDRQLKVRGHRVEPGEIEAALLRSPDVTAAYVHGDSDHVPSLTAYLVPSQVFAARSSVAEVLEQLRTLLPAHMVPEAVVWLPELPLNASGKVDTFRLPRPGRADLPVSIERIVPRDDMERRIAQAWTDVLSIPDVGIHDNFFDLGGNSLSLARLHGLLTQRIAPDLPFTALFEHTNVAALAQALTAGADTPDPVFTGPADTLRNRAARARQASARLAAARPTALRN